MERNIFGFAPAFLISQKSQIFDSFPPGEAILVRYTNSTINRNLTMNCALLMGSFQGTQDAIVIETGIVNFRQEHQPGRNIRNAAALCHQGGIGGIDV